MDLFYKDRLDIAVVPYPEVPALRIVGPLRPDRLRETPDERRFKFGSAPAAPWTMFGLVASVPQQGETRAPLSEALPPCFHCNTEQMLESCRMTEDHLRVRYPEMATTPVAVYRA